MAAGRRRVAGQISGENVIIEVAWMYYHDGLNQKDIADRLGISRATVVNYLQEARETGLIRISLAMDAFTGHQLALALCARFGLSAAYVVPDEGADTEETFFRVVRGAAEWLPSLLAPQDRLGVAWGRTVYELSSALEPQNFPELSVIQLVGSMATPYGFTAEACSSRLAQKLGAQCHNLHAPAILSRGDLAQELRAEPILRAQLDRLEHITKSLFSVGTCLPDSHIVGAGVATPEELDWYVGQGAKGVVCGRFIDAEGRAIPGPLDARMIGVDLSSLVGLEAGIVIVPGLDKVEAARACIAGGYVTHLITSKTVGEALLH
jgi:DNA-binding transcriptional regulator LsrR (DeoR family)